MLYVFHVDIGRMLNFEMSKAFENVRSLKETIERHYGIPSNSIVLLGSGGEQLQDHNRVCNYTAGTDTNPIYMFSTCTTEARNQPPWPSIDTDNDLNAQVENSLKLPATYGTVVTRAALAQKMYEMAKEEAKTCETLVHEQHLQQQGWAAVVANMEDVVQEFQERVTDFFRRYEEHQQRSKDHVDMLETFDEDLRQLSAIPILPNLMDNAELRPFGAFNEMYADVCNTATSTSSGSVKTSGNQSSAGSEKMEACTSNTYSGDGTNDTIAVSEPNETTISENDRIGISLLDWISADKGQNALKRLAAECNRGLDQLEETNMKTLKDNVNKSVGFFQREDMKEIKGLERRLYDLERKMVDVRKLVQEQNELAQSIQQNQNRASTLGDTSILPDLCASHQGQLKVILKNQKELHEIRRQCAKSKEELGKNLYIRLRHCIIPVQTRVYELDNSLLFYHTSLKRLQRHLGIIEQIHMAPSMYVGAVTEVVRRRIFSSSFLRWASDLACRLMAIYNEEVMRRHDFASQFEGHFLSTLFPGMDDLPPPFAIQAPSIFDSSLPALNEQDLKELARFLPELTEKIQLPNIDSVIDFFSSRLVDGNQSKSSGLQEFRTDMGEVISGSGRSGNEDKTTDSANNAQLPIREGCESETDTEEFEKVGQSPIDRRRKLRSKVETCSLGTSTEQVLQASAETLTEENLGTTRLEVEQLKTTLRNVYQLSQSSISFLREQLSALKSETAARQVDFRSKLEAINKCWTDLQDEARNRERETIQRMTVDHELEMNDLRKSIHLKDDEIQSLRSDNATIKSSHIDTVSKYESEKKELNNKIDQMKEVVSKLEKQLADVDVDKKKAIQEAVEQLEHKHKTEIESLRCRYKLMTSMDRSPSDTSLEKIEKPDMIDIVIHDQLLAQAREDFNREKERAIKAAIEEERQRWESVQTLKPQSRSMASSPGTPTGSSDIYRRILEEKERQLDELRDKETLLLRENQRYKETIQSLTDPELCSNQSNFKDRIEALEKEKQQLTKELEKQHNRTASGGVSIQSCAKGDLVMFVYNATYDQYTIVQNAPVLYFLHADSYAAFSLSQLVPGIVPRIIHCIGTVVDKEYCHARKDENRYKVSRGTRFYRVKVKPVPSSSGSGTSTSSSTSKSVDPDKHSQKKERSKPSELSRSSSTITDQSTTAGTPGLLIDSFAQTEQIISPLMEDSAIKSSTSRDMIDSGVVEQQKSTYKERNISVTDDEDVVYSASGSLDDGDHQQQRLRYESVCEEEHDNPSDPSQQDSNNSNTTLMLLRAFLLLNDDE
ncbi:RB1-inducible coiled-coil protein 1 isoform X3 [Aedes aegypti]|uniref:RB1-inducible coiled-coil protein 1 n=1 Tax=Aedes aegypti TaxID=7159 RepID=A0A6I8TUM6_AEDAE|nr:RB1-inducible coiled-coil protein 1 isoform X3 [Aedes aegypti]